MTQDEVTARLETFASRRNALNAKLTETGREIDVWFARQPIPVPMTELAQLEVLLKTRRDLLQELADLDDGFMDYLVGTR
jgi:hypothetical protein